MKNLFFALVLIVAPVFAAQDVISIEQGETVLCAADGGCIGMSKVAMRQMLAEMEKRAGTRCKGSI